MTNEKDREIADRIIDIWYGIGTKTQVERKSDVADEIARIRDEAYKEGFLDGCSKDGTQTERDKAMVEEAVKAERDRLDDALHALRIVLDALKRRRSGFPLDHEHEIATEEFADRILSDDQEANREKA